MAKEWKSGDLVKLKSGGPLMTVDGKNKHAEDGYNCSWFDKEDKRNQEVFKADTLEEAKKASDTIHFI